MIKMLIISFFMLSGFSVLFAEGQKDADDSDSKTYEMKIGVTVSEVSSPGQIVARFAELVEEKSNGAIIPEVFYNAVLGNDSELINKTQIGGQVQVSQISTSNLSAQLNTFNVFDLPYIFDSARANEKLFYENGAFAGPVVNAIQKEAAGKRIRVAWVAPINFRAACMGNILVKTPADIAGLKIRTSASELEQACVASFGAIPVAMGISEVYTALQTGTVDGETIPVWAAEAFKHLDAARKYSNVNFQGFTEVLIFNDPWYQSLPEELKAVVDDAANTVALEYAPEVYGAKRDQAIDAIKASGGEWYELSEDENAQFIKATSSVIDKYVGSEDVPQDWYDLVMSRLK
jgi:TRAP-type C4-dicarboxylate transport system substrate-binding protein